MSNEASNKLKHLMASADNDFSTNVYKMILMQSGFTFDIANHDDYADVLASELPNGNGYTTGGVVLAGIVITRNDVDDRIEITWTNPAWIAAGGNIGPTDGGIIYNDTHADDFVVGYCDFGADYTQPNGGTFTAINAEVRISNA